MAPFKDLRIKTNTQDWFDNEVATAIKLREKRLKQLKSSNYKLHIDENLYKEAKHHTMKLNTIRNYYQNILGLLRSEFKFSNVTENTVLQLLKGMNIERAAGIDNLPRNF